MARRSDGSSDAPALNNTTRVTAELRAAIVSGDLKPASRLRAEALAARFGTSRSPVREALLTLEREGLVEVLPNRGAVVRRFDHRDLTELYELRCILEPSVAARAASRIAAPALDELGEICERAEHLHERDSPPMSEVLGLDDRFHGVILVAADSRRLAEAMKGAVGIPHRFRALFWARPERRARALAQHREILAALKTGNDRLASASMRVHLLQAYDVLDREFDGSDAG
jgi:DNA-binding GntR family transcriptional regulator